MEEQTRAYLSARFGDYYESSTVPAPPEADRREWGYIPFSPGGTTMVRHRSLVELGRLEDFLARQAPRHVYYSAARYDDPDANSMGAKGWRGADLIFDLDADHLPGVDPEADSLASMLATCKDALGRLLDILSADFGFGEYEVVFSGGRGYHVHVRDGRLLELGRDQRREIVDYVLGADVDFESIVQTEMVSGETGRETPAPKKTLPTDGGWGKRVHDRLLALLEELRELDDEAARERLREYEGIGEKSAETVLGAIRNNAGELRAGNVEPGGAGTTKIVRALTAETVATEHAPVDEPVTTDVNRLIRLPGSLHGGSGLRVTPLGSGDLADFDPFVDAVPEPFVGDEIAVDVRDGGPTPFDEPGGDGTFTVQEGVHSVPEHIGVFLMARGRAEKGKEG